MAHLEVKLHIPMAGDSIFDQASTLAAIKPHLDALREAAGEGHVLTEKMVREKKPRGPRKPRVAKAA